MEKIELWFEIEGFNISGSSKWVEQFHKDKIDTIFELLKVKEDLDNLGLDFLLFFAKGFLTKAKTIDLLMLKANSPIELDENTINSIAEAIPLSPGSELIDNQWISNLWKQMQEWLYEKINTSKVSIESCLTSYLPSFNIADRIYFHLVETDEEKFPFGFLATYTTLIDNKISHQPLSYALKEFKNDEKALLNLLSTIFKVSKQCEIISSLIEEGQIFKPNYITSNEAYTLLKASSYIKDCGIGLRFPSWWKKKNKIHTQVQIGDSLIHGINLQSLLSVKLNFVVNNDTLSKEDFIKLLQLEEGLVKYKDQWIEINHSKLTALIKQYNEYSEKYKDGITFLQFLKMENSLSEKDEEEIEVISGEWLSSFKNHEINKINKLTLSNDFTGELRKYQQVGVDWLYQLIQLGLGSCLADDMGLGKTVQILVLISSLIQNNFLDKVLLIVPSSLLGNWSIEKDKFTPSLPMFHLNETEKKLQEMDFSQKGLYITTYKLVSLRESINKQSWDLTILDEAQAIKNPGTKQSKSIKAIDTKYKIAMTGTPIENSLFDLWSIFDFINPGLIGSKTEFKNIVKKATDHPRVYSCLRTVVEPFILRRLKTDKKVIKDLPQKIESDIYVPLSSKQVTLYKKLIERISKEIEETEGINKKGLILTTILKSKQICNHPDQYLKQDSFQDKDSGKFIALKEIVDVIKEKHEKLLVFTQYRTMVEPLSNYLESIFEHKGLTIDGSTSSKERTKRVTKFNSNHYYPYMVMTIKAGGTGLNLTSANHVIHFDRWWNPAVENQATDRAFRIGQKKVVNVYKFICQGTVEDKINAIINSKKQLSSQIIEKDPNSTVSTITSLDNDQLRELFSYSGK